MSIHTSDLSWLSPGPRLFTKLLKPLNTFLGHICFPYRDDSFILGRNKTGCQEKVDKLREMFDDLRFTINEEKAQLQPKAKTTLTSLCFEINSQKMLVSLTEDTKYIIRWVIEEVLLQKSVKSLET